jgi:hypothetical protein
VPLIDIVVGKIVVVATWELLAMVASFVEAVARTNK